MTTMVPPPRPPEIDPAELRPRRLWYWAGSVLLVLGVAGGITGFVLGIFSAVRAPDFTAEFTDGEAVTFEAERPNGDGRTWLVYTDSGLTSSDIEDHCRVEGPGGAVGDSAPYSHEFSKNGTGWSLAASLEVTEPGEYTISCTAGTDARYAVAYGDDGSDLVVGIVGALASFFLAPLLGLLIGGGILLATGVRRGRHKRRLQAERMRPWGPRGPPAGPGIPPMS